MEERHPPYQRLPGTGYRRMLPDWVLILLFFAIGIFVLLFRGRRVTLWLGPDHVLEVEDDGYRERYSRFYYGDIQAVLIRKTAAGLGMNLLLAILAALFVAFALMMDETTARIVFAAIAAFVALLLTFNWLRGPTCVCHLQTAVQTRDLCSLNRLPTARKAVDRLRPLIEAAQGRLRSGATPSPPAAALTAPPAPLNTGATPSPSAEK